MVFASSLDIAFANDAGTAAANKALVLECYQRLFGDKDLDAIDQCMSEDYIQHNPNVATGRAALKQMFAGVLAKMPNPPPKTKVDVRRAAAEGDLVWLHIRTVMPDGRLTAIVDIFRVEKGRIVEHWDVVQPVPEKAANDNGMF
jgi:predicted SnoaL-like aldol condensation-catalyzing enzyme